MELQNGMQVEVLFSVMQLGASSNQKYRGAWAEGVLLGITREICRINVKKSLMDINAKSLIKVKRFIRNAGDSFVEVCVGDVRPAPPPRLCPPDCLIKGVAVEAWETNCWWPGYIAKEILHQGQQLWLVSFPHTKILSGYPLSNLRPAQEWLGGKWTLVAPEENLNIKQVIRILSENEVEKSNNLCDVSQCFFTKDGIQAVNKKEPPSADCDSTSNPVLSSSLLNRTHLEEEIQDSEQLKGKEPMTVENDPETVMDAVQDLSGTRSARGRTKFSRRGRPIKTSK